MFFPAYFPDPIAFSFGIFQVRWYGIFLVIGIFIGYHLSAFLAKKSGIDKNKVLEIYVNSIIWGIIGARVYHVILSLEFYLKNPLQIFAIYNGGLAIHGAIFAVIATLVYYVKRYKINFYKYADIFCIPAILGQAIGRWGNYFNQELPGAPTKLPWGIPIDLAMRPLGYEEYNYFHPAFLYESVCNFFIFFILFFVFRQKCRPDGFIFWLYIALYSLVRCVMEFIRIEKVIEFFGFRVQFLISAFLFCFSLAVIVILFKKRNRGAGTGINVF